MQKSTICLRAILSLVLNFLLDLRIIKNTTRRLIPPPYGYLQILELCYKLNLILIRKSGNSIFPCGIGVEFICFLCRSYKETHQNDKMHVQFENGMIMRLREVCKMTIKREN